MRRQACVNNVACSAREMKKLSSCEDRTLTRCTTQKGSFCQTHCSQWGAKMRNSQTMLCCSDITSNAQSRRCIACWKLDSQGKMHGLTNTSSINNTVSCNRIWKSTWGANSINSNTLGQEQIQNRKIWRTYPARLGRTSIVQLWQNQPAPNSAFPHPQHPRILLFLLLTYAAVALAATENGATVPPTQRARLLPLLSLHTIRQNR